MTSRPAVRGPYAKGRLRRQEILDVALELLAVDGLHTTSLEQIARRVGITRPGLLHYFGSRELLLVAVLEARDERDIAAGIAESRAGESLADGLDRVLTRTRESPGLARLFTSFAAEATDPAHVAHVFFLERYRRIRTTVQQGILAAIDRGEVGPDVDAERAGQQVLGVLDGLQLHWLIDPELDTRAALRNAIELLLPPGPGARV